MKKRFLSLVVFFGLTVSVLSAASQVIEDWKKEITSELGTFTWKFENNLQPAKKFRGKEIFFLEQNMGGSKTTIIDPFHNNYNMIGYLAADSTENKLCTKLFNQLNAGDVFLTYDGKSSYLWLFMGSNRIENVMNKAGKPSNKYKNILMKYRSWKELPESDYLVQGKTLSDSSQHCTYDTLMDRKTGEFGILISNFGDLSATVISLKFIGKSDNVPFVMEATNEKVSAKYKSEIEEVLGPVNWNPKADFIDAKSFSGEKLFYVDESRYGTKRVIVNPASEENKPIKIEDLSFISEQKKHGISLQSAADLKKGEIFMTCEGGDSNRIHVWMMESCKNGELKEKNGVISEEGYSNLFKKFQNWKDGNKLPDVQFQEKNEYFKRDFPKWEESYSTIYNEKTGEFRLLIVNYQDPAFIYFELRYLGWAENGSFLKKMEQKIQENNVLEVGDIVMSDGSIIHPINYEKKNDVFPVGIVCNINKDKTSGIMFGIHNSYEEAKDGIPWAGNTEKQEDGSYSYRAIAYPEIDVEANDSDGSDNWDYICSVDPEGTADPAKYYPAYDYVLRYAKTHGLTGTEFEEGWYMPAGNELYDFNEHYNYSTNVVLESIGGTPIYLGFLNDFYWSWWTSTTQGEWGVFMIPWGMNIGRNYDNYKEQRDNCNVCVFRKFKIKQTVNYTVNN